eukprot:3743192-Rhodomonas_salina.1
MAGAYLEWKIYFGRMAEDDPFHIYLLFGWVYGFRICCEMVDFHSYPKKAVIFCRFGVNADMARFNRPCERPDLVLAAFGAAQLPSGGESDATQLTRRNICATSATSSITVSIVRLRGMFPIYNLEIDPEAKGEF